MAYINVAEWTPDQVTDWLKGLDNSMYHYVQSFTNNQVGGQQLLNIRPYELEQLGMHSIGHQEIVLEAVEHLRNFHYHLDKENLQFLALHVATASSCLYRQLANHCDKKEIETSILNDITQTLVYIKPLVSWLDRSPFKGHSQFMEIRDNILKFGLEMATVAQRDRFVENPVEQIQGTAQKLSKLANYIIQDITDPMVLQPASLEIVTLKKRESDLGFYITHYHGVLRITEVKFNSPAHNSGKIEEGDEIVQINYQTVVGWEYKKVLGQLQESPIDVLLTLKKRPKHTKIYGHIYMKRYRLPSNKRVLPYKWVDNIPSPRPELLSIPNYPMPLSKVPEKQVHSSLESVNSDVLTPTQSKEQDKELRMYLPKPRAVLQRRNTICGDQPTNFKHLGNVMFWLEKRSENKDDDSPSLRDKSISFGFGLELSQRPTTCLGISSVTTNVKRPDINGINGSLPEMMADTTADRNDIKNGDEEKLKTGVSKVVRFDSNMKLETYHVDSKYTCNVDNTILETFEPIPYADEEVNTHIEKSLPDVVPTVHKAKRMSKDIGVVEAVNTIVINRELIKRGKLDKSYSTPTYDDDCDNDIPPAIEPRKEYLNKIPPAPPPRPKRLQDQKKDSQIGEVAAASVTKVEPSYNNNTNTPEINLNNSQSSSSDGNSSSILSNNDSLARYTPTMKKLPPTRHFLEEIETLELLTPNKTKSLTWKKKNSLLAKRRKISLKGLGTSDIQGHLYRRAKDKHGVTYWAKLYFVLIDSAIYGFKSKDSNKANCLIFLTGFTVSIANEVHSKPFAFKVYHPSKTFYFAAETKEALSQWMEYIRQATLKGNTNSLKSNSSATSSDQSVKELFTESESSDDESNLSGSSSNRNLQNSSTNLNSAGTKNGSPESGGHNTSTKSEKIRYHLDFGSLKKFTKSNLPSFSSLHKSSSNVEKKISSNSVPVPTEQFRSYRKVPGNAGLQLGTNSMTSQPSAESQSNLNQSTTSYNSIANTSITLTPPPQPAPSTSTSPSSLSVGNSNTSTTSNLLNTPLFIEEFMLKQPSRLDIDDDEFCSQFKMKTHKSRKQYAHHYIHASNPNLVEFDFQTSKSLDHSLPKINSTNTWDAHPNLQGFVTLKDLMLQKQAEEAKEMYNNRVYLGVEKKDDRLKNKNKKYDSNNRNESNDDISNSNNKPVINRIQSRSLPKTPDYAQSFKPDDKDIIMARSKEGQKLRDFGYEFISGDDTTTAANHAAHHKSNSDNWMKRHDKVGPSSSNSLKKKSMNWMNSDFKKLNGNNNDDERLFSITTSHRQGSLKKAKNKLENLKASSEKLFQMKHDKHFFTKPSNMSSASSTISTSSTVSASSGIIPMHHSVTHYGRSSSGNEKNSYLSKLNFNNVKTAKERKLLGSPRLHRAIFGRSNSSNEAHTINIDHEVFSPIKRSSDHPESSPSGEQTPNQQSTRNSDATNSGSPDYPNMEYPPVFEPETYSLSDPNASLTLLRRRNNPK